MNTLEKLQNTLTSHGLSEQQLADVMKSIKPHLVELQEEHDIKWGSNASGYPNMIHQLLFVSVKPLVLKWIDENKPQAWFRGMFV